MADNRIELKTGDKIHGTTIVKIIRASAESDKEVLECYKASPTIGHVTGRNLLDSPSWAGLSDPDVIYITTKE